MKRVFLSVFLVLMIFLAWVLTSKGELLSPLSVRQKEEKKSERMKVWGFLPSWMVGKTIEYSNEVDSLIFLGVEVDSEGSLLWDSQGKKIKASNYLKQKEGIWQKGGKNILGVKLFEDEKLKKLMADKEAQDNLVRQLKEIIKEEKFDGVNIDFEYQGDPLAIMSVESLDFLAKLKKEDLGEISLDVFANTIIKGREEKLKQLISSVDILIVMAYDFHRPGVDYGGSVAPIKSLPGDRNISEIMDKIEVSNLDRKKIVMAYPLYGWEWKTYTKDFESKIIRGWYQMASWKRTQELIKEKELEVFWDELSMTPWLNFEENGEIRQIYFENEKSLKIKLDLVKEKELGGVAFWALGYEGEEKIWDYDNFYR